MHYKYISSPLGQKSTYNRSSRIMKFTDVKYPEVVLGVPDRVNIPCLVHDTHPC